MNRAWFWKKQAYIFADGFEAAGEGGVPAGAAIE